MPDAAAHPSPRILLWLVAVGFFMQTLDGTIVNTALPAMATSLGESPLRLQAVVVAYMLTMAALIPASGWLADRFGSQRVFLSAIVLFSAGSAACALSNDLSQLIAARVLQGLGAAVLLPVGRLVILQHFPREELLSAMSFVAIPGLIGPLIGPTLGGWLVETASWHWIFLINLPVGLVGALATMRYMPNLKRTDAGRFDLAGYAMLVLAMIAISLALDGLGGLGWASTLVVLLMVAGLAALTAYWLHAMRHPAPLFPPALFTVPSYRVGILGNLFARIGSGAMPYLLPLLLQLAMGFSPAEAGMMLLPVTLASIGAHRRLRPDDARPAAVAAHHPAGLLWRRQLHPVLGHEHRDAEGPGRRPRRQRQQPVLDGADAGPEPGHHLRLGAAARLQRLAGHRYRRLRTAGLPRRLRGGRGADGGIGGDLLAVAGGCARAGSGSRGIKRKQSPPTAPAALVPGRVRCSAQAPSGTPCASRP